MLLEVSDRSYVVFDLDDTLFPEIDFVRSGFRHISSLLEPALGKSVVDEMMARYRARQEVFGWLCQSFARAGELGVDRLLHEYRCHAPDLALPNATRELLDALAALEVPLGLLSDGRSISQRNKIRALGIEERFADIVISEEFGTAKPDPRNYRVFAERHPRGVFTMVADNPAKDFQVPSQLGWTTICLRASADNVHPQDLQQTPRPGHVVDSLADIVVRRVVA